MKTSFFYSAVLATAVASLLSSCASLHKSEFAQRKYYDFPRSRHSITEKETEYVSINSQNKIMHPDVVVHKENQDSEPIASVSATRKGIITQHLSSISKEVQINQDRLRKQDKSNIQSQHLFANSVISYKRSDIVKLIRQTPRHLPFSDAETMLFIMVVAAILIPPIGVYIKERPRLTSWFWITLVLCILAGGILMGTSIIGAGPGIWFVSVIIALLVVFDII